MTQIKSTEKIHYSVEDLVHIGDAIHSSFASIIIVANEQTSTKPAHITTAVHGHQTEVTDMLYKVLDENKVFREIVIGALVRLRFEIANRELSDQDDE